MGGCSCCLANKDEKCEALAARGGCFKGAELKSWALLSTLRAGKQGVSCSSGLVSPFQHSRGRGRAQTWASGRDTYFCLLSDCVGAKPLTQNGKTRLSRGKCPASMLPQRMLFASVSPAARGECMNDPHARVLADTIITLDQRHSTKKPYTFTEDVLLRSATQAEEIQTLPREQ